MVARGVMVVVAEGVMREEELGWRVEISWLRIPPESEEEEGREEEGREEELGWRVEISWLRIPPESEEEEGREEEGREEERGLGMAGFEGEEEEDEKWFGALLRMIGVAVLVRGCVVPL